MDSESNATSVVFDELRPHLVIDNVLESNNATNLVYLPDGKRLVATSYVGGRIGIYNGDSGEMEGTWMENGSGIAKGRLAVTRDGTRIVCSSADKKIKIWNVASRALVEEWTRPHAGPILVISPDDLLLAIGDTKLTLRYLDGGAEVKHSIKFRGKVEAMCFSPDKRNLRLACVITSYLYLIDIAKGKYVWGPVHPHGSAVDRSVMSWSHDGRTIFSASMLWSKIHRVEACTGKPIGAPWVGHTKTISCLSLSPDGSKLASASYDTIRFWDVTSGNPIGVYKQTVLSLCFSPSGEFMALSGFDKKIYLLRVPHQRLDPQAAGSQTGEALLDHPAPQAEGQQSVPTRGESNQEGLHHNSEAPGKPDEACIPSYPPSSNPSAVLLEQCQISGSRFSVQHPPLDLTQYILKDSDRCYAGGGFSDVYRGWYWGGLVPKKVHVAIKAFRFRFTSHKMLRRELGIWKRLDHSNVVPFLGIAYGFGMHGAMSLVSLWMPNDTLQNFLAKHDDDLGVAHRLQFLLDIANGLQYLHSFPVVHGDLNCNNVLLDADYTARLTDFGYSSLVGNIPEALTYFQRSTTHSGTLRWTAPEQLVLEDPLSRTTRTDIYSFGSVGLQTLSGKQPWSEIREDAAVVLRLARGYNPGRPAFRPIDDSHWSLIEHCWSSVERRPSAEALIASIEGFLSHQQPFRPSRELMGVFDNPISFGLTSDKNPTDGSFENGTCVDRDDERSAPLAGSSDFELRYAMEESTSIMEAEQVGSPCKRRRLY